MRGFLFAVACVAILASCNDDKVFQEYVDFENRSWIVNDKPKFEFTIIHPEVSYNLYWNIRNSTQYPNARIFANFSMKDTAGNVLQNKLLTEMLFEPKSGKPYGKSGLGDLFDHRVGIIKNYKFPGKGPYVVELEQFMRTDTLAGVISVGFEVEKVIAN